ncbi:MAG: FAD/NAD(P)-binding oxidoreductase, partial [Candidatus Hydrogenedentota bacterium]
TSVTGIFAAGDCVELRMPRPGRRAIEPVWYTGRMMGEVAGRNICGESASYDPGIWFNSAKFFGIEYQVYGEIRPQLPETHETLFWMHGDRRKSIRIDYEKQGGKVIGFNLMGVRYRHEVCESWIAAGTSIREVLADLGAANFDPEFFRQYESDMIEVYNRTHPESPVILRRRKSLWSALQVLASRKP